MKKTKRLDPFDVYSGINKRKRQLRDGTEVELKLNDTSVEDLTIGSGVDWAGAEIDPVIPEHLFAPASGVGGSQRIGRMVAHCGMDINLIVDCPAQTAIVVGDGGACCRFILVLDTQTKGVQCRGQDVMQTLVGNNRLVVTDVPNRNFEGRFIILKDFAVVLNNPTMFLNSVSIGEQSGLCKYVSFSLEWEEPIIVHYNTSTSSGVDAVVDNSFHLFASNSTSGLVPRVSYTCRNYYYDL